MSDISDVEDLIVQGIYVLRREKRSKPGKKDLFFYIQDLKKIEFDIFEQIIQNMVEKNMIFLSKKNSYYLTKDYEHTLLNINSSLTYNEEFVDSVIESITENNLMTPVIQMHKTPSNSTPHVSKENLDKYIDEKVNNAISPFVTSLATMIKRYEKINTEREFLSHVNAKLKDEAIINEEHIATIKELQSEITFLKSELKAKNQVIQIISNERIDSQNKNNFTSSTQEAEIPPSYKKKTIENKQTITVIGDSTIKDMKAQKLKKMLPRGSKMFIKSFPGATTSQMYHYAKPSMEYDPNFVILHCGTNDLRSKSTPEFIAAEILKLATEIKKDSNDILISGITSRNDKYSAKANLVNEKLRELCNDSEFDFIDNSNISGKQHISYDGLHLSFKGTIALGKNFCNAISV